MTNIRRGGPATPVAAVALVGLALLACKKDEKAAATTASATPSPSAAAAPAAPGAQSFEQLAASTRPVEAKPTTQPLGKYTVKAEVCTIEGGGPLGKSRSSVMPSIAVQGTRAYATDAEEKLRAYDISTNGGCKLTPVKSFGTDGVMTTNPKSRTVSASKDLVVTSGIFGGNVIKDDKVYYKCEARPQGYVALHPSGKWGIGSFANATVAKVTYTDTTCTSEPWVLQDLSKPTRKGELGNVNSVGFMGDTVLVGGILAKDVNPKEPRVVLGMSGAGKELFRLGNQEKSFSDDGLGWVHAVSGCSVGICVLDGNYKKLAMWTAKGEFIGKVKLDDLFGVKSPWINSFAVAPDKSLYFVAGVDREGGKVAEGMVFRVTGL